VESSTVSITINLGSNTLATMANRTVKTQTAGTFANFENVLGGSAADTITGNADQNYLSGGAGDDVIHGGAGNDVIIGGAGSDTLYGDAGADFIYANDGGTKDVIHTDGLDTITKDAVDVVTT
jgi:Ca2+-binding RTX toxin-like protein